MDAKLLDGKTFEMSQSKEIGRVETEDGMMHYILKHDFSDISRIYRPILSDSVTGSVAVGPKFAGAIHAVQSIQMKEMPTMVDIPVCACHKVFVQITA